MSGAGYEEARREKEAGVDTDLPTLPQNAIRIFIFKVSQDWQTWRAALQETRKRQGFWGSGGLSGEFPASFSPSGFPSVDNYSAQGDINYHQIRTFLRVKWDPISDFIRTTVLNKNLSHQTRSTVTPPHICIALCTEQLPFDPICSSPWTMREGSFPPNWWTEAKKLSDLPQTHHNVNKRFLVENYHLYIKQDIKLTSDF